MSNSLNPNLTSRHGLPEPALAGFRSQYVNTLVQTVSPPLLTHRAAGPKPLDHCSTTLRKEETTQKRPGHQDINTCPRKVPFQHLVVDPSTGEYIVADEPFLIDCKSWSCPHCGPIKRKRYVAHFTRQFSELDNVAAVTLTLDPKCGIKKHLSRKYLVYTWNKFVRRIQRHCRKHGYAKFNYCAAIEYQRNGYAHLHAVATLPITDEDIIKHWTESGGGICVYIDRYGNRNRSHNDERSIAKMVGYTMKYALKEAGSFTASKRRKYCLASQGFGYYSKSQRELRSEYSAKRNEVGVLDPIQNVTGVLLPYEGMTKDSSRCIDTITETDIEYFKTLDFENVSTKIRVRSKDTGEWVETNISNGTVTVKRAEEPPWAFIHNN